EGSAQTTPAHRLVALVHASGGMAPDAATTGSSAVVRAREAATRNSVDRKVISTAGRPPPQMSPVPAQPMGSLARTRSPVQRERRGKGEWRVRGEDARSRVRPSMGFSRQKARPRAPRATPPGRNPGEKSLGRAM